MSESEYCSVTRTIKHHWSYTMNKPWLRICHRCFKIERWDKTKAIDAEPEEKP